MKKLVLASLFAAFASVANAGLFDGQQVEFQYYFPDLSSPYGGSANGTYLVGPGAEVLNLVDGNSRTLDLDGNNITADFPGNVGFSSGSFNGFRITDINNTIAAFTSFSIVDSSTLAGGGITLSFDSNNLYVNWQSANFNPGKVVFAVNAAPVPEPETYASLLAGLGLLGAISRRRRQQKKSA